VIAARKASPPPNARASCSSETIDAFFCGKGPLSPIAINSILDPILDLCKA
jgi:hypothetical protein